MQKIETHVLCTITFCSENRAIYDITWCMRIARWISKATHTSSEYVKLIGFPLQQWLHERASMLRYIYIVCLLELMHMRINISKFTHILL